MNKIINHLLSIGAASRVFTEGGLNVEYILLKGVTPSSYKTTYDNCFALLNMGNDLLFVHTKEISKTPLAVLKDRIIYNREISNDFWYFENYSFELQIALIKKLAFGDNSVSVSYADECMLILAEIWKKSRFKIHLIKEDMISVEILSADVQAIESFLPSVYSYQKARGRDEFSITKLKKHVVQTRSFWL